MVMAAAQLKANAGDTDAGQPVTHAKLTPMLDAFDAAMSDDLGTPQALTLLEDALSVKKVPAEQKLALVSAMDNVLGLDLLALDRTALRIRPASATITEAEIEDVLARRKAARADKDFTTSDALRDELAAKGVEVMDGDPLGWEWKPIS
jgi:cysteinyl-tRNA synthetase